MSEESIAGVLAKYMPQPAVNICSGWIVRYNIHVRITRSRASKYGDYRPLKGNAGHQITVNHDLNPYAFLITFVHEVAHLLAEKNSKRRIAPHGREWKTEFSRLLHYFLQLNVFPAELVGALSSYMKDPAASSCSDQHLLRALKKFDKAVPSDVFHLEDLPPRALFKLLTRSKLLFRKGDKIRTRYQCRELITNRDYFVNALTEVILQEEASTRNTGSSFS